METVTCPGERFGKLVAYAGCDVGDECSSDPNGP